MKRIMIPTDFTVQSLSIVHNIVKNHPQERLTIHAVHMLKIPGDIMDLMFLNKTKMYRQVPETFNEAVQTLNNKYEGQIKIVFELFYGNSAAVLRNIVEAKGVTEVYMLGNFNYAKGIKQSTDFLSFFNKCKVPVYKVPLQSKVYIQGQANMLSALLGTEEKLFVKQKEQELTTL